MFDKLKGELESHTKVGVVGRVGGLQMKHLMYMKGELGFLMKGRAGPATARGPQPGHH